MHTKEELEARLIELAEYEDWYSQITSGFVGGHELRNLEVLAEQYSIEFDDWYSDRLSVEKELEKL